MTIIERLEKGNCVENVGLPMAPNRIQIPPVAGSDNGHSNENLAGPKHKTKLNCCGEGENEPKAPGPQKCMCSFD